MRAQHPTTADEFDIIVHRRGHRTVKRASARRDRRTARRELRH